MVNLYYDEYRKCAKKHLDAIKSIYNAILPYVPNIKNIKIWLELYYLSGYILEGLAIYAFYKINGWPEDRYVNEDDENFTNATGVSFKKGNGNPIHLEGHKFKKLQEVLCNEPQMTGVPFFGDGNIDDYKVDYLINNWSTGVRYFLYYNVTSPNLGRIKLNSTLIHNLINTCEEIYNKITEPNRL